MARIHKLTHPHLGPASWKEIQEAQKSVSLSRGFRVCSWCWSEIPKGRRTRCGKRNCREMLWQVQQWGRCHDLALRRDPICKKCKKRSSMEVDHIVPVSLGGTGDQSNLRGLCTDCHKGATALLRKMKAAYVAV